MIYSNIFFHEDIRNFRVGNQYLIYLYYITNMGVESLLFSLVMDEITKDIRMRYHGVYCLPRIKL